MFRKKFIALVLWTIVTVAMWSHPARSIASSTQMLTDKEKRNQIEQMYESYKKSFPRVSDVSAKEAMELTLKR